MFERLTESVGDLAERRRQRTILSIVERAVLPSGVRIEATDGGILLSGRGLLRRYLTDVNIRNLGQ
jgi:hypothetical protein